MDDRQIGLPAYEELADFRRSVADMYGRVRRQDLDPAASWQRFRDERTRLFATHSQSALSAEQKRGFSGLRYFDFDPALRFCLPVDTNVEPATVEVDLPKDGLLRLRRFGRIHFEIEGRPVSLSIYWLLGYGGGLFLPFRDATNGIETYGGGRYLLDTIKGADLGQGAEGLVLDFNYAYNPSCAYNPMWHCPLPPRENWLPVPIRAGEQAPSA